MKRTEPFPLELSRLAEEETSGEQTELHVSVWRYLRSDGMTGSSDAGRTWIDENVGPKHGFQPYYPIVVVEPEYIEFALESIRESGLTVR